jgi:hypothetical protein
MAPTSGKSNVLQHTYLHEEKVMSKFIHWFKPPLVSGIIGGILLGALLLSFSGTVVAQTISDSCGASGCHTGNAQDRLNTYQPWKASGHPYKLMKADIAQNRPIPLPEGYTWDEISYVIGGYKWKSRYLDANGYIITQGKGDVPGDTQYNYMTGEWVDYHADEENGTKPYNCGSCHTTNWVANDNPEDLTGNQDGLAGIHGTFDQGGVQCIQCHGGAMHADFGNIDRTAEACGTCHHRTAAPGDEPNVIPASGGFIKHHEQYNEFLASGSHGDFLECTSCHNPHFRAEFSIKEGSACEDCHGDIADTYAMTSMFDYQVECIDCHMPLATKSGQVTGPHQGDVMTHIFRIDTDPEANMFTEDGTAVALDEEGNAAVTMDFTCQRCHETAALDELALFAEDFHDVDKGLEDIGVNSGLTGTWWNSARSGEGILLEVGYAGGGLYMFASFYTYDSAGNQTWLTAQSTSIDGITANVDVFMPTGGKWGDAYDPNDVTATPWGSGTFTFTTCGNGGFNIMPNADMLAMGFTDLAYDITRLLESGISCPTFVNNEMAAAMKVK